MTRLTQVAAAGFDPGPDAADLLNMLAWCASAAGVAGLLIVGTQMALQMHRGEPGEGARHFRGLLIVVGACILATSAGPIVGFLGPLTLQ